MNLKEIYNNNNDNNKHVRFSDIPENWKNSFNDFMIGQTCSYDDEGVVVAYIWDFRAWYGLNKKAIERDIKINDIL